MPSAKRIRTRKRNAEESSPAQVIASNDDLLSEFLVHLPVKSLLRFKSVSKQWLSLISDPQFIRQKSLKSNPVSLLALNECHGRRLRYDVFPLQGKAPLRSLTFGDPPHDGMAIISSCKGLLLFSSSLRLHSSETKYYIHNPSTRQFRTLPSPYGQADDMQVLGLCLAFDPPKSHSYRVVCTRCRRFCYDRIQLVVYSSETGCWRLSGATVSLPRNVVSGFAVYCHGAIHWAHTGNGPSLCFDLDEELTREIPPPPPPPGDYTAQAGKIAYLGESGGHLHLVQVFNFSTKQFLIYEMERDCSCWFVKFAVDLKGSISSDYSCRSQLLHLARGEKEEDSFLVMHVHDKVFRYYFSNKTRQAIYSTRSSRKLVEFNVSNQIGSVIGWATPNVNLYFSCRIHQYIESLSLV